MILSTPQLVLALKLGPAIDRMIHFHSFYFGKILV
jgi:hypothetical protein